jgi:hypothetical protein
MNRILRASRPMLFPLLSTGLSVFAVAGLRDLGFDVQASIQAGLVLAGVLTIFGLVSLKGDNHLPTCLVRPI